MSGDTIKKTLVEHSKTAQLIEQQLKFIENECAQCATEKDSIIDQIFDKHEKIFEELKNEEQKLLSELQNLEEQSILKDSSELDKTIEVKTQFEAIKEYIEQGCDLLLALDKDSIDEITKIKSSYEQLKNSFTTAQPDLPEDEQSKSITLTNENQLQLEEHFEDLNTQLTDISNRFDLIKPKQEDLLKQIEAIYTSQDASQPSDIKKSFSQLFQKITSQKKRCEQVDGAIKELKEPLLSEYIEQRLLDQRKKNADLQQRLSTTQELLEGQQPNHLQNLISILQQAKEIKEQVDEKISIAENKQQDEIEELKNLESELEKEQHELAISKLEEELKNLESEIHDSEEIHSKKATSTNQQTTTTTTPYKQPEYSTKKIISEQQTANITKPYKQPAKEEFGFDWLKGANLLEKDDKKSFIKNLLKKISNFFKNPITNIWKTFQALTGKKHHVVNLMGRSLERVIQNAWVKATEKLAKQAIANSHLERIQDPYIREELRTNLINAIVKDAINEYWELPKQQVIPSINKLGLDFDDPKIKSHACIKQIAEALAQQQLSLQSNQTRSSDISYSTKTKTNMPDSSHVISAKHKNPKKPDPL